MASKPRLLLITGSRLRHWTLASLLSEHYAVWVVTETPPQAPAGGPAMREYFRRMDAAEQHVFPTACFQGTVIAKPFGQLQASNSIPLYPETRWAHIVTFGCSWIRRPLSDLLAARGAINLHAGLSPYYRGTACNFWARYDRRPEMVGYTIHRLDAGIDTGAVLRLDYALVLADEPFLDGFLVLRAGMTALLAELADPTEPTPQDPSKLLRYSRAADFTEAVCAEYLARL